MDWSKDSKYLRAVDQAYFKIYYNVEKKEQEKDWTKELMHPATWESSTCKLGWEVLGVYPLGADGTDVNSVDVNADCSLIAVGDDFGSLCVYRFPALSIQHDCFRAGGHSEHVARVKFFQSQEDPTDLRIISAGGNDRAYIQWKQVAKA